jgi:hypothetical protein
MRSNSKEFKKYLQKKIRINMKEWKEGRWKSQQQALAVSYSETRSHFKKKRMVRSKKSKQKKSKIYKKSNSKKRNYKNNK